MTAPVNRARSFDAWAPEYDRYRPSYPEELFTTIATQLGLPAAPHVADLGAGTGRATLAMAELGWRVTAVEPGKPMLDILRARASDRGLVVATIEAMAEETRLDPASVDLATAAQAFHWFDKPRAVAEMARIVRPGGGVALFWNVRDEERSPFVADYHRMLQQYADGADLGRYLVAGRSSGRDATHAALAQSDSFGEPTLTELRHELPMSSGEFIGMAFTASYVRGLPVERQERFRSELAGLLERHHGADAGFVVPYRIDLWTARRRGA
jgi:ubiquinone/menaquinone biosynthesis C-methylase UbiE